jgi:hypothetical protein
VVVGGTVVVVVGAAVVDVVLATSWYATKFDFSSTPSRCDDGYTFFPWRTAGDAVVTRAACGVVLCNKRRGRPNSAPQTITATPKRLPPVLWFRRAPPFSGDTVHPRRRTGGEGFGENLGDELRDAQTGIGRRPH